MPKSSDTLRAHAARVVADWPPLTDGQCRRIAALLNAGSNRGGHDAAA
jgi:hypothetical protein